jgi:WD40 repeat protein
MQDSRKCEFLNSFEGHSNVILSLAWSPKGDFIISASKDKTIRIWQTHNPLINRILRESEYEPNAIACFPDENWLAVAYDGGATLILDTVTGEILQILKGHSRDVNSVAVSPCGKYIASGGDSGEIIVWTASDGNLLHRLVTHNNWVTGLAWSPDSHFLASCSRDKSLCIWSSTGKLRQKIEGHTDHINDIKWTSFRNELVSVSSDATVRFWNKDSGEQVRIYEGHTSEVISVSFSYDGCLYATKSIDDFIYIWERKTGTVLFKISEPSSKFFFPCIAFHPSSFLLATLGDEDTIIRLWKLCPDKLVNSTQINVNLNTIKMTSILFLSADPTNASRLRLGEELREIQEKLQLAKLREQFHLNQRMSVRPADISQALLDIRPQIVHFAGHGTSTGALCFENQLGEVHPIQPDALAALFEQFADQVDCVVLNACYSEQQAAAISTHIDYVVGMNQAIGDKAAVAFTIGFYQAIGAGRTIEEAYKLGCVQIRLQGIPEHMTPILISNG